MTTLPQEDPLEKTDDLPIFLEALEKFPQQKSTNQALRENLKWEEDRYWKAHGRAKDQGKILPMRGRGGSLQRIPDTVDEVQRSGDVTQTTPATTSYDNELALYPPAQKVITGSWAQSENYDDYVVRITAQQGRTITGGKWTRPDISILGIKTYPYLPQRYFDIVTFEIKPANQVTVEGIFEALSHQQFSNRSYVIFHVTELKTDEAFSEKYPEGTRILSIARKHGIGVILATAIDDWNTWDEIIPADRVETDPEQSNRFIATCFKEEDREKVIRWHK